MKSLASLIRPARLTIPAAIALSLLGGTAAAAAPVGTSTAPVRSGPATPASFTWHPLALLNGWESAVGPHLATGTPAFALHDGVIYLRGAIKQPGRTGGENFAMLPQYARPTHDLYIQAFTLRAAPGVLFIGQDGTMDAYDGKADTFTSLGAVSFPSARATPHRLRLLNGWTSSQSPYKTGNPAYAISGGVVYLSGSLHAGTKHLAFVLPAAARPAHQMFVSVYTFSGSTGWLQILPSGQVEVHGAKSAGYTSLAAISFPAAGAKWHNFKLTGWLSGAAKFDTAAPAYTVIGGVVYLTGSMYVVQGGDVWTQLPPGARTADLTDIEIFAAKGAVGGISVSPGNAIVSSSPFSKVEAFASLAGIAYPASS